MIALVQRVHRASVTIDGRVVGRIGQGALVLLGVHRDDSTGEVDWLARKCAALRIFSDEDAKMNRSIVDIDGEALVVSQFTLYGNVERGNRPSFVESAPPEVATPLYEKFVERLSELINRPVETGQFGAMMDVELINDGPVTISIERKPGS
ncbi:MAG: D-tyrosyl-tRNA(Tyr) deacylase [Rhodothermales bacterium]|nr:D-tyrosyl-tRNA(Tyr) deacylase [Rhodothermales bacterium]